MDIRKIWLIKFPTHQYLEDVKSLASMNRLKIIDAKHAQSIGEEFVEKNPPKLTLKNAKAKKAKKPKEAEGLGEI